jgi:hypothetical protein
MKGWDILHDRNAGTCRVVGATIAVVMCNQKVESCGRVSTLREQLARVIGETHKSFRDNVIESAALVGVENREGS